MFRKKLNSDLLFNIRKAYYAPEGDVGAAQGGSSGKGEGNQLLDGSISDMKLDILNKLPEEERKAVLTEITNKVKNLQSISTKKSEELSKQLKELENSKENLAAWMKIKETVDSDPKLAKVLSKTFDDYRSGKSDKSSEEIEEDLNVIDQWIDR